MSSKQKLYLSITVSLVLLLGLILGPGWFLLNSIKTKSMALAEKHLSMQGLYKDWRNLEQARRNLKNEINDALLDQSLLDKENALSFIMELEEISKKADCKQEIRSITPPQEKKEGEQKYLSFQANLQCPFTDFFKFLIYLENMKYFVQIKNMRISQIGGLKEQSEPISGSRDIEAALDINVQIK